MTIRPRGFTLVELVAATALSAVLLTVALGVLRSVNRPTSAGPIDDTGPLARQLRWDLANAVVLRTDGGGLTLAGYGSLDPVTMEPSHLPAVVTYTLRETDGAVWLVRQQQLLAGHGDAWTELAAGGVSRFTVDAAPTDADRAASTRPAQEDPTPLSFQRLAGVRPIPPRVRVTVTFTAGPAVEVVAIR